MPANKYKLEDFQSWIKNQEYYTKETYIRKVSSFYFTRIDDAFLTCCDACCRKYDADHPNELRVGSVVPDDNCLNTDCLKIKNVWENCCQKRDFGMLCRWSDGTLGKANALGETGNDVILRWMNKVDESWQKNQSLGQEEKFIQNQLVLPPKKY